MKLVQGNLLQINEVARLYLAAFPESVKYFFPHPLPLRILKVISSGFALLLVNGGRLVLAKNEANQIIGYCIYSKPSPKRWPTALTPQYLSDTIRYSLASITNLRPRESWRLTKNKWAFVHNIRMDFQPPKKSGRIHSIAVDPQAQGLGIGTKLLKYALAELQSTPVLLEVRADNESAKALYTRLGFKYYGQTEDFLGTWLMMIKS